MIGTELRPGLWRWAAHHPQWKKEGGADAVETSDALAYLGEGHAKGKVVITIRGG